MKKISVLVLVASFLFVLGCGDNVALKGKVVFSDDKAPVPTGVICFDSGTINSRGTIKSDGTFQMGSFKDTDGLPQGNYKVFFIDVQEEIGRTKAATGEASEPIYESLIDAKYNNPNTSGLTAEVTASTKQLSFELDRNTKRKGKQ